MTGTKQSIYAMDISNELGKTNRKTTTSNGTYLCASVTQIFRYGCPNHDP